ncbi:hypothetical protein THAOC_14942 [Thalassiosira oceanica]|uniref:Uncharacterized protein n=1 Tax=Thalassiosira oceanica TaxID=159749 RepID=K0SH76_THAOC|nr:hypothetical protein THAOC_14942 [Thalassiosira oceanica]|eukprot:EJK64334.1 hypothetical protein THAOC_14942 [Thalassiosira oceanica]
MKAVTSARLDVIRKERSSGSELIAFGNSHPLYPLKVSKVVFGGRSQARSKCSIVESNEIFAKHSVGTGKITPSNIRSGQGKNRTRRGRGRKAVPYECRRVQSIGCPNMEESVYCYTNWGDDQCDPPQSPEDDGIPICIDDGWEEIDNNGDVSDIVILNEKGEFVLAKISKAHSQSISDLKRRHWRSIRERLPGLLRGKPNILRGQKRGGISSLYACFGFRKDPLSSGKVGEYAYKQSASQATRAELDELVNRLTHNLEKIGGFFLKKMPETNEFKAVREELSIPSVSGEGVSTQFRYGFECELLWTLISDVTFCRPIEQASAGATGPRLTSTTTISLHTCRSYRPKTISTTTFCTTSVSRNTK